MGRDSVRPRRRSGLLTLLCLASPLVLCLGWAALWLFARYEAVGALDGWIAAEAAHGRQWSCPDREIGGFPLQLRLTCAKPSYRGPVDRGAGEISVGAVEASAFLYQPNAVEVVFSSPMTLLKGGQDAPTTLTWSQLLMRGRLLTDGRIRFELQADDPVLDAPGQSAAAGHVEIHAAPAAGKPIQDHAYEVWFKLDRALIPQIDAATGEASPLSIDQKGFLTALDPKAIEPWPVLVEAWRQAGGTFSLTSLTLAKGDAHGEAQGMLELDEAHRLRGRIDATVTGYETLARRFGISPQALTMGTALSRLFSRQSPSAPEGTPSIKLPVSFSDGRVLVGPVALPQRLAPLY